MSTPFSCMSLSWSLLLFNALPWANLSGAKFTYDMHKRTKDVITKQEASEYIPSVHKIQRLWNVCQVKVVTFTSWGVHSEENRSKTREGEPGRPAGKQ